MFSFFRKKKNLTQENPHLSRLLDSLNISTSQHDLYLQALRHKSVYESSFENNERLEFLGDSILDSVIAEILYEKFPQAKEGFLTQIRSRIVSRDRLNKLGMALGLDQLIEVQMGRKISETSLSGNALEALIGAHYLDKGFDKTNRFIRDYIIAPNVDFNALLSSEPDPKSRLIEMAQKGRVKVYFKTQINQKEEPQDFICEVIFDNKKLSTAIGSSKKKSEQKASAKALKVLRAEN